MPYSGDNPFAFHIRWYGGYIDDLLLMWEGTLEGAEAMVSFMNHNDMNLRFTYNFAKSSIDFLDITLVGGMDGKVVVNPYHKPTASNSMLSAKTVTHPM